MLEPAALHLQSLGFVAIPLGTDRRPVLKAWPDASGDADATARRFRRRIARGLAIVTRPPLLVVDLDRNHAGGADGVEEFARLVRTHGAVPRGPRVRTRRGGLHLWFAAPPVRIRTGAGALAPGVDIKAGRMCVTCPPTDGYAWLEPPCAVAQLPAAPGWMIQALRLPEHQARQALAPMPSHVSEGATRYGRAALERETAALARAEPGGRNRALFNAALKLGSLEAAGHVAPGLVRAALENAAAACGLIADDGESQVKATIDGGLRVGRARPRQVRG